MFKKYILLLLSVLFSCYGAAQTAGRNYILTRTYTSTSQYMEQIDYYDGLGRPMQQVQKGAAPNNGDLVTLQEYDTAGRISHSWLPAMRAGNNGAFVTAANVKSNAWTVYADSAYTRPVYENSPLNRVVEQYVPGRAWLTNRKSVKSTYTTNLGGDTLTCARYEINGTGTSITLKRVGNYAANQLMAVRMEDEDGNTRFEFTDKLGRTVMSRQIQRNGATKVLHDTYYVYDDMGNLCYVLPPLATDATTSTTTTFNESTAAIKNYAYIYKYDHRNRCVWKKLPGAEYIRYIYDKADQLILSQDGEHRKTSQWLFTIPDEHGRVVLTGLCKNTVSSDGQLASAMVKAVPDINNATYKYYTVSGITLTTPQLLSVNYYDTYYFRSKEQFANLAYSTAEYNTRYGTDTDADRYKHNGLLTGSMELQLDGAATAKYLYTASYYNYNGLPVQSHHYHHLSGTNRGFTAYNYRNLPTGRKQVHTASGKTTQTEVYTYTYDHAERPKETRYKLNSNAEVSLANNTYDHIGRLIKVTRPSNATVDYTYNVRSWISSVVSNNFKQWLYYNESQFSNKPSYNGNISAMKWHSGDIERGYRYGYDNLSRLTAAQFYYGGSVSNNHTIPKVTYDKHGNITALQRWGRTRDSFNFGLIDNLTLTYTGNQLLKVAEAAAHSTLSNSREFKKYSTATTEYTFNTNGSLTKDLNKGISDIQYNSLNLPKQVDIKNPVGEARNEYVYSAGGTKLKVTRKWNPNYSRTPVIGSAVATGSLTQSKTTDYVGNLIYENGTLMKILYDGGYYEPSTNRYYYFVNDYQGNMRTVLYGDYGNIHEKGQYYPFGSVMAQETSYEDVQPYKFSGKEEDHERGLNLYDFHARQYESALGRFTSMDLMAEKYYSWSPYSYCNNNPVNSIDPDGNSTWVLTQEDGTYRVIGGDLEDRDRNIYIYSIQDGNLTRGKSIGITTSITSFYNSDEGAWADGSIIDPSDRSGDEFLTNIIMGNPPMFDDYMVNARTGGKYDFKMINTANDPIHEVDIYRGMPIGITGTGQKIYSSARDIGNIAAGYVAGANGMPWKASRIAFDTYQSISDKGLSIEGTSTRNAEYYGWRIGYNVSPTRKVTNFQESINSGIRTIWNRIKK